MLSLLDGVLSQLAHCGGGASLADLLGDLRQLINRNPFVGVLSGACTCLTTLAAKEPEAARALAATAAFYAALLHAPPAGAHTPQLLYRYLFILGQLCRRGAGLLEATPPEPGAPPLQMADCLRLFVRYCASDSPKVGGWLGWGWGWGSNELETLTALASCMPESRMISRPCPSPAPLPQMAEAALGAIGALTIARPGVLVDKRSPGWRIMKEALRPVRCAGVCTLCLLRCCCSCAVLRCCCVVLR